MNKELSPATQEFSESMANSLAEAMITSSNGFKHRQGLDKISGTIDAFAKVFQIFLDTAPSDEAKVHAIALFLSNLGDGEVSVVNLDEEGEDEDEDSNVVRFQ